MRTIYVPQGKSARLMKTSLDYGIQALYTDKFSTCNIIVCIGEDKMVLMHADFQTDLLSIKGEIDWVGDKKETLLIFRKSEGEELAKLLTKRLENFVEFTQKPLDDLEWECSGIYVSFSVLSGFEIHKQVKKYKNKQLPPKLLHHPLEQKLLSVLKIERLDPILTQLEQLNGGAKSKKKEIKSKSLLIFDGNVWEPLGDSERSIDTETQNTLNALKKHSHLKIRAFFSSKIYGAFPGEENSEIRKIFEWRIHRFYFHLEGYLNGFDHELLFRRNLLDVLNRCLVDKTLAPSPTDNRYAKEIGEILSSPEAIFDRVEEIYNDWKQKSNTQTPSFLLKELSRYVHHYYDRKYYKDFAEKSSARIEKAKVFYQKGLSKYREEEFQDAYNLLFKALKILSQCCLKNEPVVGTLYYNCGRSLQKLKKPSDAIKFLNRSLSLRKFSHAPNARIQKTIGAIKECEESLQDQESSHGPSPQYGW